MESTQPPAEPPSPMLVTSRCTGPGSGVTTTTEPDNTTGRTVTRQTSHSCPTCHQYH